MLLVFSGKEKSLKTISALIIAILRSGKLKKCDFLPKLHPSTGSNGPAHPRIMSDMMDLACMHGRRSISIDLMPNKAFQHRGYMENHIFDVVAQNRESGPIFAVFQRGVSMQMWLPHTQFWSNFNETWLDFLGNEFS